MRDVHDNDTIEELLVRSGDYLMERTAQYREQPVHTSVSRQYELPRYRRVLVGTAAAATLCVTALAGSFIGGKSSGTIDVARAAWSEVPTQVSDSVRQQFATSCNSIVAEFWRTGTPGKLNQSPMPAVLKEPSLVDFRGSTKIGVYFGGDLALVCLLFEGNGVQVQRIDGFGGQASRGPDGTLTALTLEVDARTIGLVFGDLPTNGNTVQSVQVDQSGRDATIEASVVPSVGRYVAWSPTLGDVTVKFVDETSNVSATIGPRSFLAPCLGDCFGAPTTIPAVANQ